MKKKIHINQHIIRRNSKTGERNPVITIKTYKSNNYAHEVNCKIFLQEIMGGGASPGSPPGSYATVLKTRGASESTYPLCGKDQQVLKRHSKNRL